MKNRADKVKLLRAHDKECDRLWQEWEESGYNYPPPTCPPFPAELIGMTCGAKTRAGTPCKLTSIFSNGRCRFHGGLSTGPRTKKGKARAAKNGFKPGWSKTKPMDTSQNLTQGKDADGHSG